MMETVVMVMIRHEFSISCQRVVGHLRSFKLHVLDNHLHIQKQRKKCSAIAVVLKPKCYGQT